MARQTTKRTVRAPRATAADIVGGASLRRDKVPRKWAKHHKRLSELREQLLARKGSHVREAQSESPSFSLHMGDAATDTYDRDLALSMASSGQGLLYEIDEALNRIANGTYGICEVTGKPIKPARLEAVPWTRFSSEAEASLEREGAVERTRLGSRKAVSRQTGKDMEGDAS